MQKDVNLDCLSLDDYRTSLLSDDKRLQKIKDNLRKKVGRAKEKTETWVVIYKYSLAKMNKSCIEQCFAPYPLPEELKQRLNDQIENSRDSLLEMLRPQIS